MADANNVDVGITGAIYRAPVGTTLPTTPTEELDADFEELGWVGEGGVEESPNDETKEIPAWQNGTIVRRLITKFEQQLKFTAIETSRLVLETYHKGSTITDVGSGVSRLEVLVPSPDRWTFIFDVIDGEKHLRIIAEDAEVAERGSIVYKNDEAIGYEMTVTSYPVENDDGEQVALVKLSDDAAWAPAAS